MATSQEQVTECLLALEKGDPNAADRLLPFIYDDLRALAGSLFAKQRPGQTLQPTALVHEAYLRLAGKAVSFEGRRHFFNVAARAMRQILTDYSRGRSAQKRGGEAEKVVLQESEVQAKDDSEIDLAKLDQALKGLEKANSRQARVFELRYLSGMSVAETAKITGMSARTVRLDSQMARAWVHRWLELDQQD